MPPYDGWSKPTSEKAKQLFIAISKKDVDKVVSILNSEKCWDGCGYVENALELFVRSDKRHILERDLLSLETEPDYVKTPELSGVDKDVYNVKTTPIEYAAKMLEHINSKYNSEDATQKDDIAKLWKIITELAKFNKNTTEKDYIQNFLRKAVDFKSLDEETRKIAEQFKINYFKKTMSERFGSAKAGISSFFGKQPEAASTAAPAPVTTSTAAPAPAPVTTDAPNTNIFSRLSNPFGKQQQAPVTTSTAEPAPGKKTSWWGGHKSRKQSKSRNQRKSRKQGKSRKQRKTRK